jgi:uncharacterized zinc-type alcohol dehydrogenase-like protein
MTTVAAYAAPAAKAPLERTTIELRAVREFDVLIDNKFVGICHSDIHQVREGWLGRGDLPDGPRPRDRGRRLRNRPGVTPSASSARVARHDSVFQAGVPLALSQVPDGAPQENEPTGEPEE